MGVTCKLVASKTWGSRQGSAFAYQPCPCLALYPAPEKRTPPQSRALPALAFIRRDGETEFLVQEFSYRGLDCGVEVCPLHRVAV